jgi:hypothetical protein
MIQVAIGVSLQAIKFAQLKQSKEWLNFNQLLKAKDYKQQIGRLTDEALIAETPTQGS